MINLLIIILALLLLVVVLIQRYYILKYKYDNNEKEAELNMYRNKFNNK